MNAPEEHAECGYAIAPSAKQPSSDVDENEKSTIKAAAAALNEVSGAAASNQALHACQNGEPSNQNTTKRKHEDLLESDSDIEDVTDQYVKKKRPTSPEIIEVEDVSSDEETCNAKQSASRTKAEQSSPYTRAENDNQEHHGDCDDGSDRESFSSDSDIEDVTEFMLAKKKEQFLRDMDGAIDLGDCDSNSEDDTNNAKKNPKKRRSTGRSRKRKVTDSPIEVLLDDKDIPSCPGQKCTSDDEEETTRNSDSKTPAHENDVDHSIKQRIVKLLNTGFHCGSNENEAKNAMKLARRLMERYNLDQSVLLRERGDGSLNDFSTTNDDKDGSTLGGGIVTVRIYNRKKARALSSLPRWMDFLVQPICANFHVDAFKSLSRETAYRAGECSISFYGIRTNSQLAAYAFKISSERISFMTANYNPSEVFGIKSDTKNSRLSYALGIVIGLDRSVTEELHKEEKRRKAKLNKARRAAQSDNDAFNEDSDDDHESAAHDGDDAEHPIDLTLKRLETENAAQIALIDHQKRVAEDILKVSVLMSHECL